MPSYWPPDLNLKDTDSPMDILLNASQEWQTNSQGLLELIMQTAKSESGNDMIIVHVKHVPSSRTASLFSVVMRAGNPYPARLQPKDEELSNFFKKSYWKPQSNLFGLPSALSKLQPEGRTVINEWVADTPSEFREKLAEVCNLGVIKSVILNLITSDITPEAVGDDDSPQGDQDDSPERDRPEDDQDDGVKTG